MRRMISRKTRGGGWFALSLYLLALSFFAGCAHEGSGCVGPCKVMSETAEQELGVMQEMQIFPNLELYIGEMELHCEEHEQ